MSPVLSVETSDLAEAAHELSERVGGQLWSSVGSALNDAAACTGMAGDDPTGLQWAAQYETAATRAAQAAEDVTNGAFALSTLLAATAQNYARADEASTTGERRAIDATVAGLPAPTTITLATRFSGVGGGPPNAPWGWSHVEHYARLTWPNGHQDRLVRAAAAWHRSADTLSAHATDVLLACLEPIQDGLPEYRDIRTACWALAGHLDEVAHAHRSLARSCEAFAHHLDVAHSKLEHEVLVFLAESAAIQGAGNALAFFTVGLSELAANAAEAARITATVTKIVAFLTEFANDVRELVVALPLVTETATRVSSALDSLLSVRVVVAEVAGVPGLRVLSIVRDGRTVAAATDAEGELGAVSRLEVNATEIGEGGGEYIEGATRVDVTNPKTFNPDSIKGMTSEDLRDSIPSNWDRRPTKSGDGTIYNDPIHRGRQIRIMPGYDETARPGLINHGPYAVVSQGGAKVKIPLEGKRDAAMTVDWADRLLEDVEETLEADHMGLYEFLYFLRGQKAPLSEAEMVVVSEKVLAEILRRRSDVRLVRLIWVSDYYERADGAIPSAADWQTPTEKPYLALDTV